MKKLTVPPIAIQGIRSILHELGINHIVVNKGKDSYVKFSHPATLEVTTVSFDDSALASSNTASNGPYFVVQEKKMNTEEIVTTRFKTILPMLQHLSVDQDFIVDLRERFEAAKARRIAAEAEPLSPRLGM